MLYDGGTVVVLLMQLRVDKVKLLNAVCGNPKSFEAIVSSIEVSFLIGLLTVASIVIELMVLTNVLMAK